MSDFGFGPVGDPPIVNHYPLTDGYGRTTSLVDRRLLEQAQARIAELVATPFACLTHKCGRCGGCKAAGVEDHFARLEAERDHWRAEAEKARTPDAGNPAHWRFVADLIPGHWRLRSGDTAVAGIFRREADRLESEATADDVVEKATDTEALELLKTDPQEYLRRTHRDLPPSFRRGDR